MTLRRLLVMVGLAVALGLAVSTAAAQAQITYVADLGYVQQQEGDACQLYQDPLCRATGRVEAVLIEGFLIVRGEYSGLSGAVAQELAQGVHLHRDLGLYHLDTLIRGVQSWGGTDGRILDAIYLTPDYELMLAQGRMYVDIHTAYYPEAEIRGLLRPVMPLDMEVSVP